MPSERITLKRVWYKTINIFNYKLRLFFNVYINGFITDISTWTSRSKVPWMLNFMVVGMDHYHFLCFYFKKGFAQERNCDLIWLVIDCCACCIGDCWRLGQVSLLYEAMFSAFLWFFFAKGHVPSSSFSSRFHYHLVLSGQRVSKPF